jgi:hypothetical protein
VDRALEIEGLLLRVTDRPRPVVTTDGDVDAARPIDRERTRQLFEEAFRLESATDLAFAWRPESAVSRLMWNYPAILKHLMLADLAAGDEGAARRAAERAIALLTFHEELGAERDAVIDELVRYWEARVPGHPLHVPDRPIDGGS